MPTKLKSDGKADHAEDDSGDRVLVGFGKGFVEPPANDGDSGECAGEKHGGVAGVDNDDMSGQPKIGIEHCLQYVECVTG